MLGSAKPLRPIQANVRGDDGPVILSGAAGGEQAVLNDHLLLADTRQAAGIATHFRPMQQKGRRIDVEATGFHIIISVLTSQ